MKTVNIYIETTIKSPIVKDGKYASALVFTRSNGEEAYRVMSGEECESTYNRLTLIAIIKSLQKLKEQCHVVIHTDSAYIKNISEQGAPEKWRRSEWKKATGAEVQNKELWKMYLEEAEKHETEFRFCASNDYQGLLREELT